MTFSINPWVETWQDERETALIELKAVEQKHNELKVIRLLNHIYKWNNFFLSMRKLTINVPQDEMGLYVDNDPAALEAMSKSLKLHRMQ